MINTYSCLHQLLADSQKQLDEWVAHNTFGYAMNGSIHHCFRECSESFDSAKHECAMKNEWK